MYLSRESRPISTSCSVTRILRREEDCYYPSPRTFSDPAIWNITLSSLSKQQIVRCNVVYSSWMWVAGMGCHDSWLNMLDVGEDVESCILRLLQAAEYDVNRAEWVFFDSSHIYPTNVSLLDPKRRSGFHRYPTDGRRLFHPYPSGDQDDWS